MSAQVAYKADPYWKMDALYYTMIKGDIQFFFLDTQILCPVYSKRNVGRKPQGVQLSCNVIHFVIFANKNCHF